MEVNVGKINIKVICAGIAAVTVLLGGCGESSSAPGEENTQAKSIDEIYEEISESVELYSPVEMADNFISNYYGIEMDTLEEYIFVMSEDATSAETIVIMKVKEEDDMEAITAALQVVVDAKKSEMENYLPEQFEIVKKSSVKSKGNYVYLVISEARETIEQIIEKGI